MKRAIKNIVLLAVLVVAVGCLNDTTTDAPLRNPMEVRLQLSSYDVLYCYFSLDGNLFC